MSKTEQNTILNKQAAMVSAASVQWINIRKVLPDLWIANRENQIKPTWYIYKMGGMFVRRSLNTTSIEEAQRLAKSMYLRHLEDPAAFGVSAANKAPRRISFRAVTDAWLKTVTQDIENKAATVRKFLLPYFDTVKQITDMNVIDENLIDDYKIWRRSFWVVSASSGERRRDHSGINLNYAIREGRYEEPSENTLNREYPALRQILKFAHKKGYMKRLVDVQSERGDINRRPAFAGNDFNILVTEAERWIAEVPEQDIRTRWRRQAVLDWIMVVRHTGLRPPHEADALRWRHIQLDTQCILVPEDTKTGARPVPFLDGGETRERLQSMLDRRRAHATERGQTVGDDEPVFALPDGSLIGDYGDMFNAIVSRCQFPARGDQIPYSPYSLRHSFATERLAHGMSYEMLARVMGTSPKMLQKYYDQVSVEMVKRFHDQSHGVIRERRVGIEFGDPLVLVDNNTDSNNYSRIQVTITR